MNITFGRPQIPLTLDLREKIARVISSGWVSIGKNMEALEQHFKDRFHVKHAIATSCATTGLIIAIKAAGWKNMSVGLPTFTWPSTLYAVECNGNEPHFLDIDRETWLGRYRGFFPNKLNKIIMVDTFGNQYDPENYPKKDLIIDAAHGYGLPNLGKRGIAEVVSLSFTKVVTAVEGGMILTDDDKLAETATELRRLSGRMEEVNAVIALESIKNYEINRKITTDIINKYKKHITVPYKCQDVVTATNNSVFSILFEDSNTRDAIRIALAKQGCETKVYYDPLISGIPNTDYIYQRILSLPIHEGVIHDQDEIIEIINIIGRSGKTPGKEYLTK